MNDGRGRKLQRTGTDNRERSVRIFTRTMSRSDSGSSGGRGHRLQAGRACKSAQHLQQRNDEVTAVCCDEPGEDCSSGMPASCNADCSAVLLPYFDDCERALGDAVVTFEPVVQECVSARDRRARA